MSQVAVIIPARNEEAVIGRSIDSILHQDVPVRIFVVDDHSTDRTVAEAQAIGAPPRLKIVSAPPLAEGWTGKLWAMSRGVAAAEAAGNFDYFLFTDADIVHSPDNVRLLIARAEEGYDLVSWMVELSQQSFAERALVPAFVFFFFLLYPPSSGRGAAGGCMLIRPEALRRAGGLAAIRSELIDDCALARVVRATGGRVFLAPTRQTRSIRQYTTFAEIGRMISRSAFTQLRHSTFLLIATIVGMALVFLTPLVLIMMLMFLRTLRYYGRSPLWALALPAIALFYMGATIHSAIRYWQGRGGEWKGRVQA